MVYHSIARIAIGNKPMSWGVGMAYLLNPDKALLMYAPGRYHDRIRALMSKFPSSWKEFENRLYSCPKCNTLHKRFYIRMTDGTTRLFETRFYCGKCRGSLIQVKEDDMDVNMYNCKQCGQQALRRGRDILWD